MKIQKIDIEAFRGIPDKRTINFSDKNGECCSAIIYGGNGSGKSSKSRIERSTSIRNPKRPFPINFYHARFKDPSSIITISNVGIYINLFEIIPSKYIIHIENVPINLKMLIISLKNVFQNLRLMK